MIKSLPTWRFRDIESLPIPIVELAAKAMNERYDELNKFQAAIHGVKMDDKARTKNKDGKADIPALKASFMHNAKAKLVTRSELTKAVNDG